MLDYSTGTSPISMKEARIRQKKQSGCGEQPLCKELRMATETSARVLD